VRCRCVPAPGQSGACRAEEEGTGSQSSGSRGQEEEARGREGAGSSGSREGAPPGTEDAGPREAPGNSGGTSGGGNIGRGGGKASPLQSLELCLCSSSTRVRTLWLPLAPQWERVLLHVRKLFTWLPCSSHSMILCLRYSLCLYHVALQQLCNDLVCAMQAALTCGCG